MLSVNAGLTFTTSNRTPSCSALVASVGSYDSPLDTFTHDSLCETPS